MLGDFTPRHPSHLDRLEYRAPRIFFWVSLFVGTIFYLKFANGLWFYRDDFDTFDVFRSPSRNFVEALFTSQQGHWETVHVIVFRGLASIFGLTTYLPFAVPVLLANVGITLLIRSELRRLEVRPVLYSLLPLIFFFLSSTYQNKFFASQFNYMGACFFALTAVAICQRNDANRIRSVAFSAILLLLAVMTSLVGVVMVVTTGIFLTFKHTLKFAIIVAGPALLAYVIWYVAMGSSTPTHSSSLLSPRVWLFAASAIENSLDGFFVFKFSSILVLLIAAIGIWRLPSFAPTEWAWPLASLLGIPLMYITIALGRADFGLGYARMPRFTPFGILLMFPVFALGFDYLAQTSKRILFPTLLVLLLALCLNVSDLHSSATRFKFRVLTGATQLEYCLSNGNQPICADGIISDVEPQVTIGELKHLIRVFNLKFPVLNPGIHYPLSGIPAE